MGQSVRQIELELTESAGRFRAGSHTAPVPDERVRVPPATSTGIERWSAAAATATEPCVVIDTDYGIVAASESWCTLLGVGDPITARGQHLLTVVTPLDFADGARLDDSETSKIPPMLAITSRSLARGLVRVAAGPPKHQVTLDSIATPLWDGDSVAGSLTFFAELSA